MSRQRINSNSNTRTVAAFLYRIRMKNYQFIWTMHRPLNVASPVVWVIKIESVENLGDLGWFDDMGSDMNFKLWKMEYIHRVNYAYMCLLKNSLYEIKTIAKIGNDVNNENDFIIKMTSVPKRFSWLWPSQQFVLIFSFISSLGSSRSWYCP